MTERERQDAILWLAVRYHALLPIVQDPVKTWQVLYTLKLIEQREKERSRTRGRAQCSAERLARLLPAYMSKPEGKGREAAIAKVLVAEGKGKTLEKDIKAAMQLCRDELERLREFEAAWPDWIAKQQTKLMDALDVQNEIDALVRQRRQVRKQEKPT